LKVHLPCSVFEFITLVVIGTDCIDSFKANHQLSYKWRPRRSIYEIMVYRKITNKSNISWNFNKFQCYCHALKHIRIIVLNFMPSILGFGWCLTFSILTTLYTSRFQSRTFYFSLPFTT
jgi:hypothetical protein